MMAIASSQQYMYVRLFFPRGRPIYDMDERTRFSRLNRKSSFTVAVAAADEAFATWRNNIEVQPGRHTVIKVRHKLEENTLCEAFFAQVIPSRSSSNEDLHSLPPEKRGCRFRDENEGLEILRSYSQAGCQFEFMLKYARDSCGCTPWNFPRPGGGDGSEEKGGSHALCDLFGNACFERRMGDLGEALKNGECLPDCDGVTFTYSESSTLIEYVR